MPSQTPPAAAPAANSTRTFRQFWPMAAVFAAMYFAQGLSEPTEGLLKQPVTALLDSWRFSAGDIGLFWLATSLPWAFKPAFGLLCDFVPLAGSRRRGYLVLPMGLAAACLFAMYVAPADRGDSARLLWLVLAPTIGVALADVAVDALMVEKGREFGITGRLQSVQWGAMYSATLLSGWLGGRLTQAGSTRDAFLICAVCAAGAATLAAVCVRESPGIPLREPFGPHLKSLWENLTAPSAVRIAAFLFLWSFNPFSNTVLQLHLTGHLGMTDEAYGMTSTFFAAGSLAGCVAYPLVSRRASHRALAHLAIVLGMASTLAYWGLDGEASARPISLLAGLAYMIATLIQFDLAARQCSPRVAGTMFALFMGISNLSASLSTWLGGVWRDAVADSWTPEQTFNLLVAAGAACTACCWLALPKHEEPEAE